MALGGKPKKLDADALWEYALRALDQRAYTAFDLEKKLHVRAENAVALRGVMAKLKEYGLINDARFAETFAMSRLEGQHHGQMRVLRDLQQRRVPREVASSAIDRAYSEVDASDLARQYLERKYRGRDLAEFFKVEKNLLAAYRRLRTAGFTGNVAISLLRQYTARAEELEGNDEPEPEDSGLPGQD